ncbi:MAG: hypothetical protein HY074_07945, partial [Deltaproteobacteria bacterium]|nr:hypothetical protein [Deltaproteobacteria bacterium]
MRCTSSARITAVNLQALREILSLHKPTYDVIAKFHAAGRYIKVRGNHDAAMKRPEMLAELGRVLGKPIQVFDAVLIGSGPASSGGTSAHSGTGVHLPRIGTVPGAIPVIENLHLGDLGHVAAAASLGGTSGSSGKPANDILVIHGNQVDFFNAEEHNFLGKVLVACASLPVQSTDYQAIVDESSNASFTPESVRQVLAGTLPAFTNPEWKNHITKDKPVFNSLYEGASLPLFPDKPLTEIPMHSLSQHFNVSIV